MSTLLEALLAAEKAYNAEVVRTSDLSNPFTSDDAQRLAWLSDTYEAAKRVYWASEVEKSRMWDGTSAHKIPQA